MVKDLIKKNIFEGKYEIQGEIAKGKTGTILYGYDLESRQEVAIKIYHSHINGRVIQGKPFIEKSKPLLRLDHPNLIKIFNVEEDNDIPIIFMEFFDAPNLHQIIHDKGPMPVQDMLLLAREITEVLVHIHFQGIIHGTLHPGHVLVRPQGQVKVLDMGLSWILMDMLPNCDVELLRPLQYLPPEIAKEELLEVSSDLYCLGFMMYEMLTGTVPYAGLPKTSIMGKLAFDQADPVLDFPVQTPEAICDLIRQMTRNKAKQRLQDTTHVLTIINQQLAKLPLSEEHGISAPIASQPQAPSPKEPAKSVKTRTLSTIPESPTPEPTLKKTPPSQHRHMPVHDASGQKNTLFKKLGITLGLIVLIGMAGALGYWYRDFFEPQIPALHTQPNNPSPATSLSEMTPLKSPRSVTPDQKIPRNQKPLLKKEASTKKQSQSTKKEIGRRPQSSLTPFSQQSGIKPDKPGSTQPPRSPKTKQDKALAPNKKQSGVILPPPVTKTRQPVVTTSTDSRNRPLTSHTSKNIPLQQPTSKPPKASNAQQDNALAPTKKQSEATSAPVTGKRQAAINNSADSKNTSPQQSMSLITTKETVHSEIESVQFPTSSEEIDDELSDKDIAELPLSLDDPSINLPSITES